MAFKNIIQIQFYNSDEYNNALKISTIVSVKVLKSTEHFLK